MSFEAIGVKALHDKLLELADLGTAKKELRAAVRYAIRPMVKTARSMAPRDTGDLQVSIGGGTIVPKTGDVVISAGVRIAGRKIVGEVAETITFEDGSTMDWVVKRNRSAAWRWHFAEFGTVKQMAHPFLRPAFDQHAEDMVTRFKEALGKAIVKIAKYHKGGQSSASVNVGTSGGNFKR